MDGSEIVCFTQQNEELRDNAMMRKRRKKKEFGSEKTIQSGCFRTQYEAFKPIILH